MMEERLKILEMVAGGRVSVDLAVLLLRALAAAGRMPAEEEKAVRPFLEISICLN